MDLCLPHPHPQVITQVLGTFFLSFLASPLIILRHSFNMGSAITLCFRIVLWSCNNNENTLARKWTNKLVEQRIQAQTRLSGNALDNEGGILNWGKWDDWSNNLALGNLLSIWNKIIFSFLFHTLHKNESLMVKKSKLKEPFYNRTREKFRRITS